MRFRSNAAEPGVSLIAFLLLAILLLTLNFLRAYYCGIEIDEADSYLLHLRSGLLDVVLMNPSAMAPHWFGMPEKWGVNWQAVLAANNHVLNTLAIKFTTALVGSSELSLRLPNLFAHILYLCASFHLCRSRSKQISGFLMFALLNTHPFLLTWFALSRGYGLAMGFEMLALAFLLAYIRTSPEQRKRSWALQTGACLAAALATLSHLTFSHFYLALLMVVPAIAFFRTGKHVGAAVAQESVLPSRRSLIVEALPALIVASITIPLFFVQITYMDEAENWAVQVGKSFIDTVYSLAEKTLVPYYSDVHPPETLVWTMVVLALAMVAGATVILVRQAVRNWPDSASLWTMTLPGMLLVCISAQIAQHLLLHEHYWMERLTLYFIPLCLLIVAEMVHVVSSTTHPMAKPIAYGTAVLGVTCFSLVLADSYSLNRIFYDFDQDARKVLAELTAYERTRPDHSRGLVLGASPDRERCLEFYRQTRKITWLAPLRRNLKPEDADFYYVETRQEALALQGFRFSVVKGFSRPERILLRNQKKVAW